MFTLTIKIEDFNFWYSWLVVLTLILMLGV